MWGPSACLVRVRLRLRVGFGVGVRGRVRDRVRVGVRLGLGLGFVGPVGVPRLVGRAREGEHATEVRERRVATVGGTHLELGLGWG
jgi:hypothetical protein